VLFVQFLYKKRSFYQDRLGTNIGKTQKECRFLAALMGVASNGSVEAMEWLQEGGVD
jgi:hypothetical protein